MAKRNKFCWRCGARLASFNKGNECFPCMDNVWRDDDEERPKKPRKGGRKQKDNKK